MKNQAQEIANQVKASKEPLTFSLGETTEANVRAFIAELDKNGVDAEVVLASGVPALYVSPRWDNDLLNQEEISKSASVVESQSQEIDIMGYPVQEKNRTLKTPNSDAISEITWKENGDLLVTYKSKNHPYTYCNVPESVFTDLIEIEQYGGSIGSYVAKRIKPKYSMARQSA